MEAWGIGTQNVRNKLALAELNAPRPRLANLAALSPLREMKRAELTCFKANPLLRSLCIAVYKFILQHAKVNFIMVFAIGVDHPAKLSLPLKS